MPLIQGSSQKDISANIKRERQAGKSEKQSVAIAESVADKSRHAKEDLPELTCNLPDFGDGSWIVDRDIPIFKDPGEGEYGVKELKKLCEVNNARENTCDMSPLVLGHTDEDKPETAQPPIIGYVRNYRVVNFKGEPAIIADFYIRKEHKETYKKYPRRSPEIFNDGIIDPVSLLGATTPHNDLSVRFSKKDKCKCKYTKGSPMDQTNNDLVKQVLDAIKSSDVWQYCEKKMGDEQRQLAKEEEASQFNDDEAPDEEPEAYEADEADMEPTEEEEPRPMKKRFELVGESREDEDPETKEAMDLTEEKAKERKHSKRKLAKTGDKVRLERDSLARKYSRLEAEHRNTKERFSKMERNIRRAERERDLIQLEASGYQLSVPDELDEVTDMKATQYSKHIDRIKKRYSKIPNASHLVALPGAEKSSFSRADMDKAVDLTVSGKFASYDAAVKAIKNHQA